MAKLIAQQDDGARQLLAPNNWEPSNVTALGWLVTERDTFETPVSAALSRGRWVEVIPPINIAAPTGFIPWDVVQ